MSDTTDVDEVNEIAQELDDNGIGPVVLASVGSVMLALYYYYVKGDEQRGQFVGLWPSSILALATYIKLTEIKNVLDEHVSEDSHDSHVSHDSEDEG